MKGGGVEQRRGTCGFDVMSDGVYWGGIVRLRLCEERKFREESIKFTVKCARKDRWADCTGSGSDTLYA